MFDPNRRHGIVIRHDRLGGRLPWAAIALLLCGCAGATSVVRSQFANYQSCPEDEVAVDDESATRYRAHGCEKEATYVCSAQAAFKGAIQCVQEELPSPPGYREAERPVLPPPDPRVLPSH